MPIVELTGNQEEALHCIIYAYEIDEVEMLSVYGVASRLGISSELAEQLLSELEELELVERDEFGVIVEAENNGYYP